MNENVKGIIISGVGGLYTVRTDSGEMLSCRAKGAFRRTGSAPLAGDRVLVRVPSLAGEDYLIEAISPRRNSLIRPPIANLDVLFITFAPIEPVPSTLYLDKLSSIAVYEKIKPVMVITKIDLSPEKASEYEELYRKAGFSVFPCSCTNGSGLSELSHYVRQETDGICAFAGASGVGKSTLMNTLFPSLSLETGVLSEKISRGRHTTRSVTLYPKAELTGTSSPGYVADTPGFSMLDFLEFDFYTVEDLPHCFPEFEPFLGECRYTDCSHTKETDCGIIRAVGRGDIPQSRHDSYLSLYADLAQKRPWKKKN
ncbi:MAG: ribosome small subunit-dependent GTPase A [Clostridiales bacterium]|nr:MAG: ribosome small subunit-dependent GTPase A [Clostridiales bacterium]